MIGFETAGVLYYFRRENKYRNLDLRKLLSVLTPEFSEIKK
jgi:hypothetical protein